MKNHDRNNAVTIFTRTNYFELFAYFDTASNAKKALKFVIIDDSPGLTTLPSLPEWVPNLIVRNCPDLKRITQLPAKLSLLSIDSCPQLTHVEGKVIDVRTLAVRDCRKFEIQSDQYLTCRFANKQV